MGKSAIRWITLIIILSLLVFLALQRMGLFEADAAGDQAEAPPSRARQALPVSIEVVAPSVLKDQLTVSGTLEADESVDLSSEVAGKITSISFREGAYVKRGQVMVQLDASDLRAQLEKVKYQRELAQQQEKRRRQLLDKGGLSQEEYDQVATELKTLEAEIELLKVRISKTRILAPFSGEVGFRYVSEGSYVSPGTRMANLVKTDPIKIGFTVPERYSLLMKPGLPVQFTLEGVEDTLQAAVYARAPSIDTETRSLSVKAKADNSEGRLSPGAFATVTVQLQAFDSALMVPTRAVMPERERQVVYLFDGGVARATEIKTGIRRTDRVQVVEGLQSGDTLITSGLIQMGPGQPVSLEEEK
jgi:membrane fusion protein, multidrug efflux system